MNTAITPHPSALSAAERMRCTGSRPVVYWMTGLSGAGKSTIAARAEAALVRNGHAAVMIDGDTVRTGLCTGLGFSPEDRHENLRRIAHLARTTALTGQIVLVCTISPDQASREQARKILEPDVVFCEVYVKAPLELCMQRDPKGLYKRAVAGEIRQFTGISAPYEEPLHPDLVLDTAHTSAEVCAETLFRDALFQIYQPHRLLGMMIRAARQASDTILRIYNSSYDVSFKEDASPLTTADLASDAVITSCLHEAFPEYDILSEEETDSTGRLSNQAGVFIVDPMDGTKEFVNRNGEFCVSIGFAAQHRVLAGVIAVPVRGWLYTAFAGMGAYKCTFAEAEAEGFLFTDGKKLAVSDRTDRIVAVVSRSHMDIQTQELLRRNENRILDTISVGSCLKGCYIAEGLADVHYRYGAFTKEWDTAAMEVICRESGAVFTDGNGNIPPANRADPVNRTGFIILNHPASALCTDTVQ